MLIFRGTLGWGALERDLRTGGEEKILRTFYDASGLRMVSRMGCPFLQKTHRRKGIESDADHRRQRGYVRGMSLEAVGIFRRGDKRRHSQGKEFATTTLKIVREKGIVEKSVGRGEGNWGQRKFLTAKEFFPDFKREKILGKERRPNLKVLSALERDASTKESSRPAKLGGLNQDTAGRHWTVGKGVVRCQKKRGGTPYWGAGGGGKKLLIVLGESHKIKSRVGLYFLLRKGGA